MTALAGFWSFRSGYPSSTACANQLDAQASAGSDPQSWAGGPIALGRNKSDFLPEDRYDRGPVRRGGGAFVLVADVRLDNRAELARALSLPSADLAVTSDAALLADCLFKWGEAALGRIVGDFAFALWDGARERLLLGRDFIGQRPLHYASGPGFFAFASMPRGLHALTQVPKQPDVRAALGFMHNEGQPAGSTFFANVFQVPPGHLIEVREGSVRSSRWWRFEPSATKPGSFGEAVEEGRERLAASVESRLRRTKGIASHLSGGLDSSGVAATAAHLLQHARDPLVCFTAVPQAGRLQAPAGTITNEWDLASEVASRWPNIDHVAVTGGARLTDVFERNSSLWERPVPNTFNDLWWSRISSMAGARNASVLLTATMGNIGLSHSGDELLSELIRSLRLGALAGEIARTAQARGAGMRSIASAMLRPFLPAPVNALVRRARGTADSREFITARGLELHPGRGVRAGADCALAQRIETIATVDPGPFVAGAAAGWGVDLRDPLADRRLIEFALSLPADYYWRDGERRALARHVLADRVPSHIVRESRKGFQAADWYLTLRSNRDELIEEANAIARSDAGAFVNCATVIHALETLPEEGWARPYAMHRYDQLVRALSAGHFYRTALLQLRAPPGAGCRS